jgi:3-hydroxy-9,10-secoandrosta-1,3,5(10)-triene-9,17-dione monooxygenase
MQAIAPATATNAHEAAAPPTAEELVQRARSLIPALKERADAANATRRLPQDTVRDLHDAGLFRILQPKRWGGYELDPGVYFDVQMTLAEGCMSTAWVFGVIGVHNFQLALFDLKAQQDVWGEDSSIRISSSYQPVGKVEKVDGGFRLSGRWGFSSGCEYCDWVFVGALYWPNGDKGPPDMRTFLVPRKDYRILDTWKTFGLQGTGSHDIVIEDAFVPEYRTHRAFDGFMGTNPGRAVNGGALYQLPWAQVFVRSVSSAAIGATQGALDAFIDIAAKRVSTNTGKATKADPFAMNAIAKTQSAIDDMKGTLHRSFREMMSRVRAGKEITLQERVQWRYQSSQVGRRCADLVDDLLPLLGGRAIYNDSPIIRYWLDLNASRAHVANDPTLIGTTLGGMSVGIESQDSFV